MSGLIPSSADKQAFTREVWKRFNTVTALMRRVQGVVVIPPDILYAMNIARRIALRHARSDFRHDEREMRYEQEVARWLVETWARLHGNPVPDIKFGPHN